MLFLAQHEYVNVPIDLDCLTWLRVYAIFKNWKKEKIAKLATNNCANQKHAIKLKRLQINKLKFRTECGPLFGEDNKHLKLD